MESFARSILVFAGGVAVGLSVHSNFYVHNPWPKTTTSYFYQSMIGGDPALQIDNHGRIIPGREYDRDTEAKKLIEVMRLMAGHPAAPCTNVSYFPPAGGLIEIKPGSAFPNLKIESQRN